MTPKAGALATWRRVPERGTVLGIRFVVGLYRLGGRRAAVAFVCLLAFYYALFDRRARRVSADYLRRARLPASFGGVVTHLSSFARVALDRLLFLTGRTESLELHVHASDLFARIQASGRGALFLGAHVGSFEAMRALAATDGVRLAILADFRNAQRIQRVLEELAPGAGLSVIALDPARPTSMLDVKAFVDQGGMVALLADRVTDGETRAAEVDFLGGRALLPTGPYLLAHMLGCPVYAFVATFTPPNRYDVRCEPFADKVTLPRATRAEAAAAYAQAYARTVESQLALAPYNWFNFFDFWKA